MGNTMMLPMTASLTTGSLEAYIQSVNRFPVLSAEEESRLARRFRDLAGIMNQRIARSADDAYFLAAGMPMKLK